MLNVQEGLRKKLAEDYWLAKLSAFAKEPVATKQTAEKPSRVSAELSAEGVRFIEKIGKGNFWGKYTVFLAVYSFLLGRYFNQKNVLIAGSEPFVLFGLELQPEMLLKELVVAAQAEVTEALKYRSAGMDELHGRAFDFSFTYSDDVAQAVNNQGFALNVIQEGDSASVVLYHDETRVPLYVAEQFVRSYTKLVDGLASALQHQIKQIDIISEKLPLQNEANTQALQYANIIQMFEHCVQQFPNRKALSFGSTTYTYSELNYKVNQLARCFITEYNAGPSSRIGLMVRRTDWIALGMLAILKTGAAFVPIDPENPVERSRHIISNACIDLLLLESETIFALEDYSGNIFATDLQADNLSYEGTDLDVAINRNDLAYIMYTSGTTGTPKGAMIEHHCIVNYATWLQYAFGLNENDSSVLLSSYAFDLGYTSVFGSLLLGGHLHIYGADVTRHPEQVLHYLIDHQVSFIKTTPSLFYILTHIPEFTQLAVQLPMRSIFLGGEPIKIRDLELYLQYNKRPTFINHYGPTETTIGTAACIMNSERIKDYALLNLIGRPALNNEIIILDEHLQPVPAGCYGEICIGGEGVARGYYKSETLTAEKFVSHPLKEGKRLYRSGDQGKMLEDGTISLAGRKDNQLKIRGYRVELAEIEKALLTHETAGEVKVLPRQTGENIGLIAYIRSSQQLSANEWREFLAASLPDYMIPSAFIMLERFPLSPHGKIDADALLQLYNEEVETESYTAPENEVEKLLVDIWQEVLGKNKIGTTESFFDLGGNSLLMVQANSIINKHYPKVTIADLFAYTNISSLSAYISDLANGQVTEVQNGHIQLPAAYFREFDGFMPGDLDNYDYHFNIKGEAYAAIMNAAAENEVDVWAMAVAFFCYALSEACGKEIIPVQACNGSDRIVRHLNIDLSVVEDEGSLYRNVASELNDPETALSYSLNEENKVRFSGKERTNVLPFIFNGQLPHDVPMLRNYDLLLGMQLLNDRMEFLFRYDGLKLKQQKAEQFIQHYIRIIESVVV